MLNLSTENHIRLILEGHTSIGKFMRLCKKLYPYEYEALINEGYFPRKIYLEVVEEDGNLFYNETSQSSGEKYMVWEGYI